MTERIYITMLFNTIILFDVYCEISRVVEARIARVPKARVRCGALTMSDISHMYLSYASAHVLNSSNHSYVSMTMNMDSVNEHELFSLESLLRPNIYRSFFDNGIPESSAPLLDLPIPPSIDILPESHESPRRGPQPHRGLEDPLHSENIVASAEPLLFLDDAELEQFIDQQKNCNTKRKTESDLRRWYAWCTSVGEKYNIGEIPPAELDRLLRHFYVKLST